MSRSILKLWMIQSNVLTAVAARGWIIGDLALWSSLSIDRCGIREITETLSDMAVLVTDCWRLDMSSSGCMSEECGRTLSSVPTGAGWKFSVDILWMFLLITDGVQAAGFVNFSAVK